MEPQSNRDPIKIKIHLKIRSWNPTYPTYPTAQTTIPYNPANPSNPSHPCNLSHFLNLPIPRNLSKPFQSPQTVSTSQNPSNLPSPPIPPQSLKALWISQPLSTSQKIFNHDQTIHILLNPIPIHSIPFHSIPSIQPHPFSYRQKQNPPFPLSSKIQTIQNHPMKSSSNHPSKQWEEKRSTSTPDIKHIKYSKNSRQEKHSQSITYFIIEPARYS